MAISLRFAASSFLIGRFLAFSVSAAVFRHRGIDKAESGKRTIYSIETALGRNCLFSALRANAKSSAGPASARRSGALNSEITAFASEPGLECDSMAVSSPPFAGVARPSCMKKIRCPAPQSGAVRNSSGPAAPCCDAIRETRSHVVQQQIGKQRGPLLAQRRSVRRIRCFHHRRVARIAVHFAEKFLSVEN